MVSYKKVLKQQGFTVVEVMMSIGIFGLIMPSIILGVVGVARLNDRAADLTRANIIAEQKLEVLRSQGFNTLNNGTIDFTDELNLSFTEPRSATYTVTTLSPGVKQIDLNIQYTDAGVNRELDFRSIQTELGVAQ